MLFFSLCLCLTHSAHFDGVDPISNCQKHLSAIVASYRDTGLYYMAVTRFGEFCSCCCYHFCLNFHAAFSQPGNGLIAKPCRMGGRRTTAKNPKGHSQKICLRQCLMFESKHAKTLEKHFCILFFSLPSFKHTRKSLVVLMMLGAIHL